MSTKGVICLVERCLQSSFEVGGVTYVIATILETFEDIYELLFVHEKSGRRDSNPGPLPPQGSALPLRYAPN